MKWSHVHTTDAINQSNRTLVQSIGVRSDGHTFYVNEDVHNGKVKNAKSRARKALDDYLDAPKILIHDNAHELYPHEDYDE